MPKTAQTGIFTSMHFRRETHLIFLAEEMGNKFCGPVVAQDFIDRYLANVEKAPRWRSKKVKNAIKKLTEIHKETFETAMYDPLIDALTQFCPCMEIVNTSKHADTTNTSDEQSQIKPDLTMYKVEDIERLRKDRQAEDLYIRRRSGDAKAQPRALRDFQVVTDMSWAQAHIEVKLSEKDDAFCDDASSPFIHDTIDGKDTRGQIISYAVAQLAHQYRTHLFSILIGKTWARLIRWDRSGAVVTERIDISTKAGAKLLAEFFWRFSHASDADRGLDATVTRFSKFRYISEPDGTGNRQVMTCMTPTVDDNVELARTKLQLKARDDVWRFAVYDDAAKQRTPISCYGGKPFFRGRGTVTGRCTRVISVWVPVGDRSVLLKDTWRVDAKYMVKEGDTYRQLHEHRVHHIPKCYEAGDIPLPHHHTMTDGVCFPGEKPLRLRQHQHYRLLLQDVGHDLTQFENTREFVAAMRDALIAHQEAYKVAGILHRDISVGNILIGKDGGGFLIDWDLSKPVDLLGKIAREIERTGTWQFIAARALMAHDGDSEDHEAEDEEMDELDVPKTSQGSEVAEEAESKEPNETSQESNDLEQLDQSQTSRLMIEDDLESFFHVLSWVTLRYAKHSFGVEMLGTIMQEVFDYATPSPKAPGGCVGFLSKPSFITFKYLSRNGKLPATALRVLADALENVFAVRYEEPITPTEIEECRATYNSASEERRTWLRKRDIHTKYMLRLDDLNSKWMINRFTDAVNTEKGWPNELSKRIVHALPEKTSQKRKNEEDMACPSSDKRSRPN